MFDSISKDVQSFNALPKKVWALLGVIELMCVLGLILPGVFHWPLTLTVEAAVILALESLVFIGVHSKYREPSAITMSAILGVIMVFIAYGRMVLP